MSLVDFSSFSQESYDYPDDEVRESRRYLYFEDGILADELSDGRWCVINGAWDGHIDETGEFICDYTGDGCGKDYHIITQEEMDRTERVKHDQYGLLRAKEVIKNRSFRNMLQNETDSWLGDIRI